MGFYLCAFFEKKACQERLGSQARPLEAVDLMAAKSCSKYSPASGHNCGTVPPPPLPHCRHYIHNHTQPSASASADTPDWFPEEDPRSFNRRRKDCEGGGPPCPPPEQVAPGEAYPGGQPSAESQANAIVVCAVVLKRDERGLLFSDRRSQRFCFAGTR